MSTPVGKQQVSSIGVITESDGIRTNSVYMVTLANGTRLTVDGQCDALDAALAALRSGVLTFPSVTFPLTVTPNRELWNVG